MVKIKTMESIINTLQSICGIILLSVAISDWLRYDKEPSNMYVLLIILCFM